MNFSMLFRRRILPFLLLGLIVVFFGCQDEMVIEPADTEPTTDQGALEKIVDEDSALTSFDYNYDEEGLMDFLGKVDIEIFPFRVGHKMRLVNRTLSIDIQDTIAYGTLTKTFEGILFIAATYDPNGIEPDTVIKKPFTAVVTRNIIFKKIAHTPYPMRNWRIAAISLPKGGTQSPNIDIMKLTAFLPSGDTIQVDSPTDYYVTWRFGWWRQIPVLHRGESVMLRVELFSAYEEEDFVTLTYGANRFHRHRAKKLFELVSSTPSGSGWEKVYEQTYTTHQFPGFYHAVINAMPRQVVFDDATPVESEAWGIPYLVLP
ncbi:MAG: hypothetical protein KJO12_00375 [Ignavibacteria bacterium]|nr:hypothetical protein [Ignavibacteria bacterium]